MTGGGLVRLSGLCLSSPWQALAVLLAFVIASASGLTQLGIRTDARSLLESRRSFLQYEQEIRDHFQVDDPILIAVRNLDGSVYDLQFIDLLTSLTEAVRRFDFVREDSVVSLATERFAQTGTGSLDFPRLFAAGANSVGLDRIREYVRGLDIYRGTLVSHDERAAAVLFYLDPDDGDRTASIQALREMIALYDRKGVAITLAGVPVAESLLGHHIAQDFARFFPMGVVVICLVVWCFFGRWELMMISAVNIAAINLFVFGLLGHVVGFVEITTSVLPAFMAFVAVVDDIHIFSHLASSASGDTRRQVLTALGRLHRPLLLTSLTTCVGFASFTVSSIPAVRHFGVSASAGTLFALLWSFTFTPILLTTIFRSPQPVRHLRLTTLVLLAIYRLAGRKSAKWGVVAAILLMFGGIGRLQMQDGWEQGFSSRSELARDFAEINRSFSGSHVLHVELLAEGERPFGTPKLLLQVRRFEQFIASLPGVGGVAGPDRYLSAVAVAQGKPKMAAEPQGGDVERLVVALDLALGRVRRNQILDDALQTALVTVFLNRSDYRSASHVMAAIERYVDEEEGVSFSLAFAGGVSVGRVVIGELVQSLVTAAVIAPILCALLLSIAYHSPMGALACIPTLVSVGCVLGLMGWLGIPLGVATSVYLAVTLGVGIDFAVHLLDRQHRQDRQGIAKVGSAVIVDATAVMGCVLVLTLSAVPATYRLGWLVAASIASSSFLSLFWAQMVRRAIK